MAEFKTNPLIEQFKAAGRLANEWRDTLTYGALLTGAVANAYFGNPVPSDKIFSCVVLRETVRSASWHMSGDTCLAGEGDGKSRPRSQCVLAAASVACGLGAISLGTQLPFMPEVGVFMALCMGSHLLYGRRAGGGKEVLATYEYMWDWPRKKGGGGQTERFKEGVRGLIEKLTPARQAPSPV